MVSLVVSFQHSMELRFLAVVSFVELALVFSVLIAFASVLLAPLFGSMFSLVMVPELVFSVPVASDVVEVLVSVLDLVVLAVEHALSVVHVVLLALVEVVVLCLI